MEKTEVWYLNTDGGDGSAYPVFYLTEEDTEAQEEISQNVYDGGFAETCNGMIETFVGSNVHKEAVENTEDLRRDEVRLARLKEVSSSMKEAYKTYGHVSYYNDEEFTAFIAEKERGVSD